MFKVNNETPEMMPMTHWPLGSPCLILLSFFIFTWLVFMPCMAEQQLSGMELEEKEEKKDEKDTGNWLERAQRERLSVHSRLKAI